MESAAAGRPPNCGRGGPWKAKAVLASDTATTRAVAVATAVAGSPPRPERLGARLIMVLLAYSQWMLDAGMEARGD